MVIGGGVRGAATSRIHGFVSSGGRLRVAGCVNLSRAAGECCPGSALTSIILNFINTSRRKLSNVRDCCSGRLANVTKHIITTGGTVNASVPFACRGIRRTIGNGSLILAVSSCVRCAYRGCLRATVRRGRVTRHNTTIIVGIGANTILTVTIGNSFGPGSPFALSAISRRGISTLASSTRGAALEGRLLGHR